jgi:uncharacterized protein YodC (DUF2158 family)
MTVTEKSFDVEWLCTWFTRKRVKIGNFRAEVLELVPRESFKKIESSQDAKPFSKSVRVCTGFSLKIILRM